MPWLVLRMYFHSTRFNIRRTEKDLTTSKKAILFALLKSHLFLKELLYVAYI